MSQEAVHSSSSILRDSRHFGLGSNSFEGICPNGSPLTDGQRSLAKHFCQRLHFFFALQERPHRDDLNLILARVRFHLPQQRFTLRSPSLMIHLP